MAIEPDPGCPPLTLRLFGPFEARLHGQPLPPVHPRRGYCLLAWLALRSGREAERSQLAGVLWPESDEPLALYNLRRTLTALRRALGPEAHRLQTPSLRTLSLALAEEEADFLTFDALIARADDAALERAIALYRGPLLEGWTEEWVFQERQVREEAYLAALEKLAAGATARGEHGEAVGHLRRAVTADPLRESAQRALMQALAASGSYGAAVEVYRELRSLLHRELNTEPDRQTRHLFEQIRAEARRRAAPASSHHGDTETRRGAQTESRIPRPLTRLIGRESEVQEVKAALAGARLVTLTGAGGVGKTRLAIGIAEAVGNDYADGVWFVELAALADPALVPQTVAAVLGVREQPGCPIEEVLLTFLGAKQLLLVLDNCEHLIAACARLAEALLRACPPLRLLVTSREGLNIAGETTYRVPSLSVPAPHRVPTLEELTRFEAARLFVERARAAVPSFALTPENAPAVAQVCQRLDGIPLAIELAAAQMRAMPLEQIAARLDDRFRLLTGGSRTALPRHRTLRATMEWSYALLAEPERVLLQRLSVFAGGFTLEAVGGVCGAPGVTPRCPMGHVRCPRLAVEAPRGDVGCPLSHLRRPIRVRAREIGYCAFRDAVLDLLTRLVEKSLLEVEEAGGEGRYRLLETVRQYARERLLEAGEEDWVRERHRDWFLALAEEAQPELETSRQQEWLERLEREHDNLRAALEWCQLEGRRQQAEGSSDRSVAVPGACAGDVQLPTANCLPGAGPPTGAPPSTGAEAGLRLGGALWHFWMARGCYTEGRGRLARVLGLPGAEARTTARARALLTAACLAFHQWDLRAARALGEEGLAIYRELGNERGIAHSLELLGWMDLFQGDYGAARVLHEESLAIYREVSDKRGIALSLVGLGVGALHAQEGYDEARALLEESLAISRELGDRWNIARALKFLGWAEGDAGEAQALYEESLAICRELGEREHAASALRSLGSVALSQGDLGAARALLEESLAIYRELGGNLEWILEGFVALAAAQGRLEQAARLCGAAEALPHALGASLLRGERARYERCLASLRAALGEEAFAAARAEGRAMTLEEAIRCALEESGMATDGGEGS